MNTTNLQPDTMIIPRQRVAEFEFVEPVRDQARPGDVDDRGRTLCFSGDADMGVWLTPNEIGRWV